MRITDPEIKEEHRLLFWTIALRLPAHSQALLEAGVDIDYYAKILEEECNEPYPAPQLVNALVHLENDQIRHAILQRISDPSMRNAYMSYFYRKQGLRRLRRLEP